MITVQPLLVIVLPLVMVAMVANPSANTDTVDFQHLCSIMYVCMCVCMHSMYVVHVHSVRGNHTD